MTPGESTVYELRGNQSQVIGRASGCELQVDLPHISGSHCTVRPSGTSEVTGRHSNLGPTDGTDPLMGLDSKPGPTVFALCSVRRASTAPRSWTSPPMARASTASPSAGRTAGPKQRPLLSARAHLQGAPGSSGWLGAPRGETGPLGAQPLPRVLELAATKAADFPGSFSFRQKEGDLREGDMITFTKLVGQITEFPKMVFHACDVPKPAAAAARRSKRGRTGSDAGGGAEAEAEGEGGAEGGALAGEPTLRMASSAVGTPFSDGRLDLAFKDLAYEREQVPRRAHAHAHAPSRSRCTCCGCRGRASRLGRMCPA